MCYKILLRKIVATITGTGELLIWTERVLPGSKSLKVREIYALAVNRHYV